MAITVNTSSPWLEKHPRIAGFLNGGAFTFRYLFTGGWIVDLVRWLIDTGGNIAESAFVLATVYVTINTVAHLLVTWLLPDDAIRSLNQMSVIAFSVLPELIVVAAMAVTFDHWCMVARTRRVDAWVWAVAYTLPTFVFLCMTVYTITSFVTFEVSSTLVTHVVNGKQVTVAVAASPQATGTILVIRCLAGWSYGMVQMLWVKLGKKGYASLVVNLRNEIVALGDTVANRDVVVTGLQEQVTNMQAQIEQQGKELLDARLQIATAKVTRKSDIDTVVHGSDITEEEVTTNSKVTSLHGDAKRLKLKKHIRGVVLAGGPINYKQIAAATGLSYNMVRNHAKSIIEEIKSERTADELQSVEADA